MTSFLYVSIIMSLFSVGAQIFLSARVGDRVLLPCVLDTPLRQTLYIQWRTDYEVVFKRIGGTVFQGERYVDRVDIPEDELSKGNCSLVLKEVGPKDAGIYRSYLWVRPTKRAASDNWRLIQTVELRLDDSPEKPKSKDVAVMKAPQLLIFSFSLLSCLL